MSISSSLQTIVPPSQTLYPYQIEGVKFLLTRKRSILADEMGCLSGDTQISYNRAGLTKKCSLKKLYDRAHKTKGQKWDARIPTYIRALCGKEFRLHKVLDIIYSGRKETYEVTLKSGKTIRATVEHEFLKANNTWVPFNKLTKGDVLLTNGNVIVKKDPVTSIKYHGIEDVYDIKMAAPFHNFIAGGIVVHNCGKTPQAFVTANGYGSTRIVIICPAIGRHTLAHEAQIWCTLPHKVKVIDSSRVKIKNDDSIIIISYHLANTPKFKNFLIRFLKGSSNSLLICDEAHNLCSWKAAWTRSILIDISPNAAHLLLLTGTPYRNKITDLHPMFSACEPKLWGKFKDFANYYSFPVPSQHGYGIDYVGKRNVNELRKKASIFMIRRFKKDVLKDLPPKIYSNVYLDIPAAIAKKSLENSEEIVAAIKKGSVLKLGKESHGQLATMRKELGIAKVSAIQDWLDDFFSNNSDTQLVLFCYHVAVADALLSFLESKKISCAEILGRTPPNTREKNISGFQSGSLQVLVCNILAAGTVINLQNAHTCAFAELDWTNANLDQAVDRLHRIGTKEKVSIFFLLAENSIDTVIIKVLRRKKKDIEAVVN